MANNCKLYIGNLSNNTSNQELRQHFSQCGQITDSVVIVDRDTGRPRGFGFVTFSSEQEAQAAIQQLNEQECNGRLLRVDLAKTQPGGGYGGGGGRGYGGGGGGYGGGGNSYGGGGVLSKSKLYVGNLGRITTDDVLRDAFSQHGKVIDCIAMRGFGFVIFASEEQAHNAIHSMNGQRLDDRRIRVKVADEHSGRGGGSSYRGGGSDGGYGGGGGDYGGGNGPGFSNCSSCDRLW
ncbi:hypothetical protein DFH06DRAFT_71382 [Mycena polygramma]|nr:hypothetical protein DFH06DRAFT_71382 [Mycena polygramma]